MHIRGKKDMLTHMLSYRLYKGRWSSWRSTKWKNMCLARWMRGKTHLVRDSKILTVNSARPTMFIIHLPPVFLMRILLCGSYFILGLNPSLPSVELVCHFLTVPVLFVGSMRKGWREAPPLFLPSEIRSWSCHSPSLLHSQII